MVRNAITAALAVALLAAPAVGQEVLPRAAIRDVLDGRFRDTEATSNLAVVTANAGAQFPDLSNLVLRELGLCVPRSAGLSPLRLTISQVVLVGAEPKMIGINAGGVVATMQNLQRARDGAYKQLVRDAMGFFDTIANPEMPVSLAVSSRLPFPTLARCHIDFFQKANDETGHDSASIVPGRVISGKAAVIDGDSLRVDGHNVRLYGIAAIELRNPLGPASAEVLRALVGNDRVTCRVEAIDRYNRPVGRCLAGQRDLSAEMVRSGWAANYTRFTDAYEALEREARDECRGVWAALPRCR